MTREQLWALKQELDEVVALRDNLKATQERCNELLEESRTQKRTIKALELQVRELLDRLVEKEMLGDVEVVDELPPMPAEVEEVPVPERTSPPPALHDPFDNSDMVLDGSRPESDSDVGTFNPEKTDILKSIIADTSGSFGPFPSPHKQPPFQPHGGFDRGLVVDGGGAAWRSRGPRFD